MKNVKYINTLKSLKAYYNDKTEKIYVSFDDYENEALDMAIEVLERQTSEDCISRAEALKHSHIEYDDDGEGHRVIYTEDIEELPSVTPQPKIGHWIEVDIRNCHATLKCSVCDRIIEPTFTFGEYSYEDINRYYPYCHCGAKMEVEE